MKNKSLYLLLSLVLCISVGCSKEDPVNAVIYSLTVINESSVDLDMYLKSTLNPSYVSYGTVLIGADKVITNLAMDVEYTLGFIEEGGDPSDIVNEQTIRETNPEIRNYSLTITD